MKKNEWFVLGAVIIAIEIILTALGIIFGYRHGELLSFILWLAGLSCVAAGFMEKDKKNRKKK